MYDWCLQEDRRRVECGGRVYFIKEEENFETGDLELLIAERL